VSAEAILEELGRFGISVRVVGENLRCRPAQALRDRPELLEKVRQAKPELVALLQRHPDLLRARWDELAAQQLLFQTNERLRLAYPPPKVCAGRVLPLWTDYTNAIDRAYHKQDMEALKRSLREYEQVARAEFRAWLLAYREEKLKESEDTMKKKPRLRPERCFVCEGTEFYDRSPWNGGGWVCARCHLVAGEE